MKKKKALQVKGQRCTSCTKVSFFRVVSSDIHSWKKVFSMVLRLKMESWYINNPVSCKWVTCPLDWPPPVWPPTMESLSGGCFVCGWFILIKQNIFQLASIMLPYLPFHIRQHFFVPFCLGLHVQFLPTKPSCLRPFSSQQDYRVALCVRVLGVMWFLPLGSSHISATGTNATAWFAIILWISRPSRNFQRFQTCKNSNTDMWTTSQHISQRKVLVHILQHTMTLVLAM